MSNEYDNIKNLISNIKIDEDYIKNIIFLLSNYITKSNADYLYNSTYLTSYTYEFIKFLNMFLKKQQIVEHLKEYINKTYKSEGLHIKIDLTWDIISSEVSITNLDSNRIIDDRLYIEIIRGDINVMEFYYIQDTVIDKIKYKIDEFIKIYGLERNDYERECAVSEID